MGPLRPTGRSRGYVAAAAVAAGLQLAAAEVEARWLEGPARADLAGRGRTAAAAESASQPVEEWPGSTSRLAAAEAAAAGELR